MFKDLLLQMKDGFDRVNNEPFVIESGRFKSMHFDHASTQSLMDLQAPMKLVVDYTKSIMGFLFFQPNPKNIAMIGLGGGSIAKYCHHHLPSSHFLVIENNPKVIALRNKFHIPEDDSRFEVKVADGAIFIKNTDRQFDVLIVDGFDKHGQPSQLCSKKFYDNCFRALRPDGILVINLCGEMEGNRRYQDLVNQSFQNASVMVLERGHVNQVLFACKGNMLAVSIEDLIAQAAELHKKHAFDVAQVAQNFLFYRQLNERSRKTLNYQTPAERFAQTVTSTG